MAIVILLWFALAINYVDRQIPYSIFPALKTDLGFTDARLGLIGTLFAWIYTVCMPFAGRLADLYRQDRLIIASLVLFSVATIGCSASGSASAFLAWRAGIGFTEALYYPAAVGMIATFYAPAARSRALGIHQSAQFAGLVVGGWYGGWMADHVSWRAGFAVAGGAGLLYAAALACGRAALEVIEALFANADVLIAPAAPGAAPQGLASTGDPLFNRPWQLLGCPSVALPGGLDARGLPLGLQVIGRPHDDERVFAAAAWIESALQTGAIALGRCLD